MQKYIIWSSDLNDREAAGCRVFPSLAHAESAVKQLLELRPKAMYYIAQLATSYRLGDRPLIKDDGVTKCEIE